MSKPGVIAARDEIGKLYWFKVDDAKSWRSTALLGAEDLFFVEGHWAALSRMAFIRAEPARLIDDLEAVEWFARNGYEPPEELREYADARRLGQDRSTISTES